MQRTLFDPIDIHPVPHNGTETSKQAAQKAKHRASSDASMILALIAARGDMGLTCDEVITATGLEHQTASARVSGLAKQDLIRDSGLKRKTRKNCNAVVYVKA